MKAYSHIEGKEVVILECGHGVWRGWSKCQIRQTEQNLVSQSILATKLQAILTHSKTLQDSLNRHIG